MVEVLKGRCSSHPVASLAYLAVLPHKPFWNREHNSCSSSHGPRGEDYQQKEADWRMQKECHLAQFCHKLHLLASYILCFF